MVKKNKIGIGAITLCVIVFSIIMIGCNSNKKRNDKLLNETCCYSKVIKYNLSRDGDGTNFIDFEFIVDGILYKKSEIIYDENKQVMNDSIYVRFSCDNIDNYELVF